MSATKMKFESTFYITGGTLDRDAVSYVVRQGDRDLYDGLNQGRFCYVLTSRQMGKSSLMVRTAARLREAGVGIAVLDLTAIGQNLSAEQWYGGLLSKMGQQLELEEELLEFWDAHPKIGPMQRWISAIRQVVLTRNAQRVVVFVDEIDAVRSLPFSTDEFFAGIREFYNWRTEDVESKRLTFCLLGVATPSDLIRDTRMTPFNIGQRIELHDFVEVEAASLAQGLRREEKEGAALLKRILYWTGGHPYLTQQLCQAVAEDASVTSSEGVNRLCRELFFTPRAKERDDNLLFVRERMLRSEVDVAGLLSLYGQVYRHKQVKDDESNPLVSILRLSGITRVEDGRLRVRNRIYERVFGRAWVTQNMPEAEVRRQRAAYRRGLLRAAVIATLIIAALGSLAFVALRQRDRARQQEQAKQRLLYAAHMNLVAPAWESHNLRLVNDLLEEQRPQAGQEDLRGFEWHYLWRLSHQYSSTLQHNDIVFSVAFSPDGMRLVAGCADRTVKLWDITTSRKPRTLKGHSESVLSVAFSPDGKRLASGSTDRTVKLWDAATGQELLTLNGHSNIVSSVAFSPDGTRLATGSVDRTVKLWDATTGQQLRSLTGHPDAVWSVAFSSDGKRLATGSADRTVKLWDAVTSQELLTLTGNSNVIYSVAFSPDGKRLATGSADRTVKLWDAATGQELHTLTGHSDVIRSVAFSPDGKELASASNDRMVKLWDAATGREERTLMGHLDSVWSVAFSSDGKRLATGSADRTVKLWEVATSQELLRGHSKAVLSVAFSPDGKRLATGSADATVKLWDAATGQELLNLIGHSRAIHSVAFSPDGKRLATGSADRTVRLWDAITGQELHTLMRHSDSLLSVAFSPDGTKLATSSYGFDDTVKLWNTATGHELLTLKGVSGTVSSVAFSPDGTRLATSSDGPKDSAKLWNAATGQELFSLKGHSSQVWSVAFSPDGKRIATGSHDQTVKLWDAATGEELLTLKGHSSPVNSVAFSPDGKRLASGSEDRTVRLWDVATGQELLALRGHSSAVYSVAFSPDGKWLASGSADLTVRLWEAAAQEVFARSRK